MKTIDIRLLVDDEVDAEDVTAAIKDGKVPSILPRIRGAVDLINDGFSNLVPSPQVRVRGRLPFVWMGQPIE